MMSFSPRKDPGTQLAYWRLFKYNQGLIPPEGAVKISVRPNIHGFQALQHSCLENHHGQRSLVGYSTWGCKESDTTERLSTAEPLLPLPSPPMPSTTSSSFSSSSFFSFYLSPSLFFSFSVSACFSLSLNFLIVRHYIWINPGLIIYLWLFLSYFLSPLSLCSLWNVLNIILHLFQLFYISWNIILISRGFCCGYVHDSFFIVPFSCSMDAIFSKTSLRILIMLNRCCVWLFSTPLTVAL